MDGESTFSNVKSKVLSFSENHPYILLTCVVILVIIMIIIYLNHRGFLKNKQGFKKGKKKEYDSIDDEMDDLIQDIHERQKKGPNRQSK